jgi:hypothetical protein
LVKTNTCNCSGTGLKQDYRADFRKIFRTAFVPIMLIRAGAKAPVSLSLRVKLRRGDVEIEIQGTQKEVEDAFSHIEEYADKFLKTFSPAAKPITDEEALEPTEDVPRIVNAKSNANAVKQLLVSGWAHRPRTLKEIVDALRVSGLYVQSTDISGILTNLVRRGEISRTKTEQGYGYYVAFAKVGRGVRLMGPTEKPKDPEDE